MNRLKQYIRDLMYDKKRGALSQVVKLGLLALSYIYGLAVLLHNFFSKVKLLKSYKSRTAVISVGNITLGGTGKTPFAIMLAENFAQKNKKTAVLIRGYGNDEWKMLKEKLGRCGVKVLVGKDRVRSAREAENSGISVVILDDGFQHRRLKRDIDIVLLDSTNPFGNGRLFPRGILREPMTALKKADIIVLTKADKGKENIAGIERSLRKIAPGKLVLKAEHAPGRLFDIRERIIEEASYIRGKTVCMLSGICDGSYFKYTVEKIGAHIELEFIFPDHYAYGAADLGRVLGECRRKGIDIIITKEKDAVKLRKIPIEISKPRILALSVELELTRGKEEIDALLA